MSAELSLLRDAAFLVLIATSLGGCAAYRALPLSAGATLPSAIPTLAIDPSQMPMPELSSHRFDPADGLDITEVAMLAVINNPELKIARAATGVAHAQAFAAGLLPDPSLAVGADVPDRGQPGTTTAYSFGLSYDVVALLTRAPRYAAARSDARKTDLDLLWQEWQVVSMARRLFVQLTLEQQLMDLLQRTHVVFADRERRVTIALERGLMALDAVTPHRVALQDVDRQINDVERLLTVGRHDLSDLLGLSPDVPIRLAGPVVLPELDEAAVATLLPALPTRRPDLIALQAGYAAQDQRYRAAILSQFPSLGIGFTRASDAGNVRTSGLNVSLNLPLFNRNRGAIAIEEATRQRMRTEYEQRLNTANSGIVRILAEQRINRRQLQGVEQGVAALARTAEQFDAAFVARNVDALGFASLQASLLAKRIEQLTLEQAILEQQVALQTLIGGELPVRLAQ